MAVGMVNGNWDLGLRDASLGTWSKPTRSKKLDAIHEKKTKLPVAKDPRSATASASRYLHGCMSRMSKFYRLWPAALQRELCRFLQTEVLVRGETVVSRGASPTKALFIVSGKGPNIAHADVVVDSAGAVVLSLTYKDFLLTFKEVLGLRQQDRLTYLRSHPVFADVSLADLDVASDTLQLAFLPAKTMLCLGGKKLADTGGKVYFLAEGECVVRRATPESRNQTDSHRKWRGIYDTDTVSTLGPLDMFGLPNQAPDLFVETTTQAPDLFVETTTQVRLFHVAHEDFLDFPPIMRNRAEEAFRHKLEYLAGRLKGLQQLDYARKAAGYGAFTYKLGNVVMHSGATASASMGAPHPVEKTVSDVGQEQEPNPEDEGGDEGEPEAEPKAEPEQKKVVQPSSNQMGTLLQKLRANQTIGALEATRQPDRYSGLPPLTNVHWGASTSHAEQGSPGSPAWKRKPSSAPSQYDVDPADSSQQQGQRSNGGGGSSKAGTNIRSSLGSLAGAPKRASRPHPFDLNLMRPGDMAWPKVEGSRANVVQSELPHPQHVPWTVRDRHLAIFQRARLVSPRDATRIARGVLGPHDDDDDDDVEGELRRLSSGPHNLDPTGSIRLGKGGDRAVNGRKSSGGIAGATVPRQYSVDRDLHRPMELHTIEPHSTNIVSEMLSGAHGEGEFGSHRNGEPGTESRAGLSGGNGIVVLQPDGWIPGFGGQWSSPFEDDGEGYSDVSSSGGRPAEVSYAGSSSLADGNQTSKKRHGQSNLGQQGGGLVSEAELVDLGATRTERQYQQEQPSSSNQGQFMPREQLSSPREGGLDSPQAGSEMDMALPPSVLLGYEAFDPFQWAAIMSYQPNSRQGMGSGGGMGLHGGAAEDRYWQVPRDPLEPEFHFGSIMSKNYFDEIVAALTLPPPEVSRRNDPFGPVRTWLTECNKAWQEAALAGTMLIPDETMIFWTGLGGHLTYMPRKPTPLGICLKSLADTSRIVFNVELVEGKEQDSLKEFYAEYGATLATTLRLCKPWFGSGRQILADSWFGSVKCCLEMYSCGLFCIMSVKTAHKGFPKGKIKAALKERGSCGTSNPGKAAVRKRVRINKGEKVVLHYRLEQPQMFEAYRSNFNAIDCADRLALGPNSIIEVWKTKNVHHRIFAATLAMCEQNAYQALTTYRAHKFGDLSRDEWRRQLRAALVRFKEPVARVVPVVPGMVSDSRLTSFMRACIQSSTVIRRPKRHFETLGKIGYIYVTCGYRPHTKLKYTPRPRDPSKRILIS
eukprot:gene2138-18187_t